MFACVSPIQHFLHVKHICQRIRGDCFARAAAKHPALQAYDILARVASLIRLQFFVLNYYNLKQCNYTKQGAKFLFVMLGCFLQIHQFVIYRNHLHVFQLTVEEYYRSYSIIDA